MPTQRKQLWPGAKRPVAVSQCMSIWISAKVCPEKGCGGEAYSSFQRGAGASHASQGSVAMGLRRHRGLLCEHCSFHLIMGWIISSCGGRWKGPTGSPHCLYMFLSPSSPIASSCCQPDLIPSQQPSGLTTQQWEPRNGLTTKQAPNKLPSPEVNGLSPVGREMAPNLPLGQGAGITRDSIFSHWLHILLPTGADWKQEQLLPWGAELCFSLTAGTSAPFPYQLQPWYIQPQLSLLVHWLYFSCLLSSNLVLVPPGTCTHGGRKPYIHSANGAYRVYGLFCLIFLVLPVSI